MVAASGIPGVAFAVAPAPPPSTLRSDVAGFIGDARRGPVGVLTRVVGWREYMRLFGGLESGLVAPYAIQGYFDNGGQITHVLRVAGSGVAKAAATMTIGASLPPSSGFVAQQYAWSATSAGAWANGTTITLDYRLDGLTGAPEVDVMVQAPDEPIEQFTSLDPSTLDTVLDSALVTVAPVGAAPAGSAPGPRSMSFSIVLGGGIDAPPALADYQAAVVAIDNEPEVALVALPDLHTDLPDDVDRFAVLAAAMRGATDLHDRLVVVDAPPGSDDARIALAWFAALRAAADQDTLRNAAAYHPPLWIPDPLGGVAAPQRLMPPSGLVTGVISRLDRERGAYYTPANAPITDAVDASQVYSDADGGLLVGGGVNLLVCRCGRGLQVWGGRTLELFDPNGIYVAHRRLIHRLVRAIRQVAQPLVFEGNQPQLWLALARTITSVLLAAFRAGALAGATAQQAFNVQCDATTNPPEQQDLGQCVCLVSVAPAVPMEFITLRIAVSADGSIEAT